ncbi:type IV pilus assembly protein PilM [Patescibacteria group bacterium]|nr:type IV pilus assembly protein PilM [Patescibacteria group bacterium]
MFNFSKKLAFGLDLSDISLKIVQFREDHGKFSMSSFIKQDIPIGLVKEGVIEKEDELVSIFKRAFAKPNGLPFSGREVICSLPEEKVFVRVIQLPKMKKEELADAIKWEAEAHIPLSIEEVYLGWKIIDPISEDIDHFDILIAATPKYVIDKYLSFLRKVNLTPIAFEPESSSVVRSLIKKNDLNPTIIIDIGATGTNFVIFSASATRFTSHVDISGNLFNQEIMKKLKVSEKEANQLKIKVGLDKTKGDSKTCKAIEPIIDDLGKQIKDYIDFYHDHSDHVHSQKKDITQIMLCGGDSHLLGLSEILNLKLNLPVKLGNPLVNITVDREPSLTKKELLINTTAIGLALRQII